MPQNIGEGVPYHTLPVPPRKFTGIEYPGLVADIPRALGSLGGLSTINERLEENHPIELDLNPATPFFHLVRANTVPTGHLLLEVKKRRRRRPLVNPDTGEVTETGQFAVQALGSIPSTVRFRAMADYQYHSMPNDKVTDLVDGMRRLDADTITSFEFDQPTENWDPTHYLPPPIFTQHILPQWFEYKGTNATEHMVSTKPSGEEVSRLVNTTKMRHRVVSTQAISFTGGVVPKSPPPEAVAKHEEVLSSGNAPQKELEARLAAIFADRPVWTRVALRNQLNEMEAKLFSQSKYLIALYAYEFHDGPFDDVLIRIGYDPRLDPEARFYQRISTRNLANMRKKRSQIAGASAPTVPQYSQQSHLFNGAVANSLVGNFQLCDISDPLLKRLINDPAPVRETCAIEEGGWYTSEHFQMLRNITRRKFLGAVEGKVVTDEECADLLLEGVKDGSKAGTKEGSYTSEGQASTTLKQLKKPWTSRGKKSGPGPKKGKARPSTERFRQAIGLDSGGEGREGEGGVQ